MPSVFELLDAHRPAAQAPAAPQEETVGDALRKGFDSGTTKFGSDLNQLAGLGGEIVGANDFAQNRYAAAKAGRERAATEGPEIDSLGKINSFGTALRYGAGQLGAMAPVAGAAIAGGVLARNPFIGGTMGLAPTSMGEVATRQMEDPTVAALPAGERGLRVLAGGTAAAAVQNFGPGMFAGKVAGKLAGTEAAALGKQSLSGIMAKNVAEGVGVNAVGSGAGEAITQYATNPDAKFNNEQILDSAAAGGVMGVPFGVAGGAAQGLRSRGSNISSAVRDAAGAVGDKFGAAKDAAVEKFGGAKDATVEGAGNLKDLAVEKYGEAKDLAADAGVEGRKKINSLSDDIGEMYARGRDSLNETFDKISKDEPLVGLKEFATEAGQKLSDSRAAQAVTDFATRASESAGLTPEMRQKLVDVAGNATDKTTQLAAVALKKTFDAGVFINTKLTGAYDTLRAGMDAENAKSGTKQSADYSGTDRAIAAKLEPMLARREDITQRPDSVNKLVGVMRELASDPSKISVNSDTLVSLMDTLGSDTGKMLDAAYGALQKDGPARPGAAEAFYQKLDEVNAAQKRAGSLKDFIGSSLTDEAKKSVPPSEYGSLAQTLSRVVRGEYGDPNAGPYQRKAQEAQLQSLLTDHFGDKADAVLSKVRKESQLQDKQLSEGETSRGNSLESDKVNEASDAKFDESGNRIGKSENDSRTFGLSEGGRALEGGKAVMDPDTFMSTRQEGKNNARQLITDLKVKYPDQDVRFERIPGSDMGHVIVEKAKNSEHFTDGDLKAMEIYKSRDYKNNAGLLEVGGRELDARKIASLAGKKSAGEGRADGTSRAQRLSDTFMDGIARLMEQHGNFAVRDEAVIGEVGGKDFTFGDAIKMQRDSRAEDRMSKAGQKELAALRKLYKTADSSIREEIIKSVQKLTEKEKNKELAGGDDLGSPRSEGKPLTRGGLQGPERPGDPTIRPKSEPVEASGGSARADAMTRLTKAHERNQREYGADAKTDMGKFPFEERDARYDSDGNLTKTGAAELLAGDYNGGIDVNGRSTHERDKTDFKDGEGRTELGKDENISRVMVGDKDAAFAGRKPSDKLRTGEELMKDRSDVRPNEDLVSRSNMDGSAKSVNDYANDENMKPAIGLKNQLLARDEAAATAIANRLGTLIENASILRAGDRFTLSKLRADASPDQTQAIINPIAKKYADVIMAIKNGKQGKPAVGTVRGADNKNGGFPDLPKQKELQPADKGNVPAERGRPAAPERTARDARQNELDETFGEPSYTRQAAARTGDEPLGKNAADTINQLKKRAEPLDPTTEWLQSHPDYDPETGQLAGVDVPKKFLANREPEKPSGILDKAIDKRMDYMDNPPDDYNSKVVKQNLEWAGKQKERVDAEVKKIGSTMDTPEFNNDRYDTVSNLQSKLRQFITDSKAHLENEKDMLAADKANGTDLFGGNADKEGTPSPKSPAAKKAALLEAASSSNPALIKELSTTDNARGLQRTTVELAKSTPESKASEVANKRMGELVQDPDTALNLTKKFDSADASGSAKTDTPEARAAVGDYITKTLGDSVKLKFADLTHAGEFERMRLNDVIRLSTTALDPMSTAHHEALHAFFAQLKDAKATDISAVLEKAAASENVMRQLNERYAGNDAVLAQLKDPEERAAYMYQHWAAGDLKIGPQAKNVFTKIADYIRSVMGIWTNDQRATKILEYFNDGEYAKSGRDVGAAREALINKGHNNAVAAAKSFTEPLMKLGDAVLGTGSGRLRDTNIPAIQKIADLIKRNDTDVRGGDQGFISAARIEATKRRGALAEALQGYSPENLKDALQGLQTGQKASTPEGRLAQKVIKNTLQQTRDYLIKNGVDVGDLGPDYFPRVWDTHYISKNQQAFKDMLEPHVRRGDLGSSDDLMRSLLSRGGNEFGIEKRTLTEQGQDAAQPYRAAATDRRALDGSPIDVGARPPGFQFKKERSLAFITPEEASMFVNKDLMGTLNSYINQATRKAEWTNRLGGGKLEALLQQAREQGATPDQIKLTDTYLKGVDGTLGDNLNPHARRIMGNMIVYQNIRLLPFAAFSSVVDPAGVLVRGGSIKDAFATFKRGISEIPESFGRKGTTDHATYMSELVGVVDKAILTGTLGDIYTQGMVGGFAEKANNFFFKANLMEGLNRSFRIGATEAAAKFITRHADGTDSVHSARWIKELGLEQSDIKTTSDGHLALTREDGLSEKQVDRVHAALNQWVDGAVLRPDAADKPIWFNDPHFALISHLKQFTYAFQKVIIGRVVHEYKQGNYAPAMALASYVPIMLAADTAKGLIQGGGDQPDWKKGWDMSDYLGYAVQRGGLLGVGQFGLDVAKDIHRGGAGIGALTGPTIEQFGDAVQLLGGHKQFGPFVLNALPANALYAHAFGKSDVADPMFAD